MLDGAARRSSDVEHALSEADEQLLRGGSGPGTSNLAKRMPSLLRGTRAHGKESYGDAYEGRFQVRIARKCHAHVC
jgi:hypothetical protein